MGDDKPFVLEKTVAGIRPAARHRQRIFPAERAAGELSAPAAGGECRRVGWGRPIVRSRWSRVRFVTGGPQGPPSLWDLIYAADRVPLGGHPAQSGRFAGGPGPGASPGPSQTRALPRTPISPRPTPGPWEPCSGESGRVDRSPRPTRSLSTMAIPPRAGRTRRTPPRPIPLAGEAPPTPLSPRQERP